MEVVPRVPTYFRTRQLPETSFRELVTQRVPVFRTPTDIESAFLRSPLSDLSVEV